MLNLIKEESIANVKNKASFRQRCAQVYSKLKEKRKLSIRKISEETQIPKSSVHRSQKVIEQRSCCPESTFWETPTGLSYLHLLYCAVIFVFGIMCGVGAEKISLFFKYIRLDKYAGTSPSAIRSFRTKIEEKLTEYQQQQESHLIEDNKKLEIVAGVDETFFEQMILVFMDLSSGYIFIEDISENRTYVTWNKKVSTTIKKFGLKVLYMVSDRAKALIKLATEGLHCNSIPDLFHVSYDISKLIGKVLNNKLRSLSKKIEKIEAELLLLAKMCNIKELKTKEELLSQYINEKKVIEESQDKYKKVLHKLSLAIHIIDYETHKKQTTEKVRVELFKLEEEIQNLIIENNINDKKNILKKYSNQINDLSVLIDEWWFWFEKQINDYELSEDMNQWIRGYLLPVVYWQKQVDKTKNKELKKIYQKTLEESQIRLGKHDLTSQHLQEEQWIKLCEWLISKFQRTTSAVEGRNGCLAQMHHNGRGIQKSRLKALTAVHNFGLKRFDGTTAAERLSGIIFPDIFEWLLIEIGEIPLPRTRGVNQVNYLILQTVPP